MNILFLLSVLLIVIGINCVASNHIHKIPSYLKVCHKNDPNLNDCIRDSIERLRPQLARGVPDLLIPSCDPLSIPEIVITQNSGAIRMESQYSNIVVTGLSNFTLRSVRLDPESHKFRIKLWFPTLEMTSDYHIHGKLLMMPLSGSGKSNGTFTDVDATVSMKADVVQINGKDHYKVYDIFVEFNIGGASVFLSNLFNGDEELGTTMNKFLNDYWKEVTAEMRPSLSKSIENILRAVTGRVFETYPLEQILPD